MRKTVPKVNWYRVEVCKEKGGGTYFWYGSSAMSREQLISALQRGEYILLDNLLYWDSSDRKNPGTYKEWTEWDQALIPSIHLNPYYVISVLQFKGDPRKS